MRVLAELDWLARRQAHEARPAVHCLELALQPRGLDTRAAPP